MFERWVKAYEKLLDWEWGNDPYVFTFFVKLLLLVNVSTKRWHGRTIKRGQMLTSMRHLEERFGWSHHTIQRILDSLQSTGEITVESDKGGTLITVVNYSRYQGEGVAAFATPSATPSATNIRIIEDKNERREDINTHTHTAREGFEKLGTFHNVVLSPSDIETIKMHLAAEGLDDDFLNRCIDKLSAFMMQNGRTYTNHAAAILSWVKAAVLEEDIKTGKVKPKPAAMSSKKETPEEEIIRIAWSAMTDSEKKDYMDKHNGQTLIQTHGAP